MGDESMSNLLLKAGASGDAQRLPWVKAMVHAGEMMFSTVQPRSICECRNCSWTYLSILDENILCSFIAEIIIILCYLYLSCNGLGFHSMNVETHILPAVESCMLRRECVRLRRKNSHHVGNGSRKQAFVPKDRGWLNCRQQRLVKNTLNTPQHIVTPRNWWEDDSAQVEKKSNLDVLDKRGWNVVIYAIETQMLTDVRASDPSAATASEFLGIPRNSSVLRSIHCWWSWARTQRSFYELAILRIQPSVCPVGFTRPENGWRWWQHHDKDW